MGCHHRRHLGRDHPLTDTVTDELRASTGSSADSFPRQYARTRRLTLGTPRDLRMTADGRSVMFLRSSAGDDPVNALWVADLDGGGERLVVDPRTLGTAGAESAAERAIRERRREQAGGITSFATDRTGRIVTFALDGVPHVCDIDSGVASTVATDSPAFDPRLSPDGELLAHVEGRRLRVTSIDTGATLIDLGEEDPNVSWGLAEFIAAEEMGRQRGHWWSPEGRRLAVCRVDESPVAEWNLSDVASPWEAPRTVRYPAAGTTNAAVSLHIVDLDSGNRTEIDWSASGAEYLASVNWGPEGLLLTTQDRSQRHLEVVLADPESGSTAVIRAIDDDSWVDLVPGAPALLPGGRLVTCEERDGSRRLCVDGEPRSPEGLQVRSVVAADDHGVVFTANPVDDPTVLHLWTMEGSGSRPVAQPDGIISAVVGGGRLITRTTSLSSHSADWMLPDGTALADHSETPLVRPEVTLLDDGWCSVAVLLPRDHDGSPLPVIVDSYGGPHARRVARSSAAFTSSQWFADQGFAVVVIDGRGTPGRGSAHERAVAGSLSDGVLDDQVRGLGLAAEAVPALDLERVAIRGWSFGGYLAAMAVMRRPDVFHCGVAGAPVTDWRWYDTHYTERYLGSPAEAPERYDADSLVVGPARLERPLLLIHGLADDNVVAAHTLRLSSALLAAGCPHEVLPLVGVSHMTPQEVVAENLLLHQLDFIRRSLPH